MESPVVQCQQLIRRVNKCHISGLPGLSSEVLQLISVSECKIEQCSHKEKKVNNTQSGIRKMSKASDLYWAGIKDN